MNKNLSLILVVLAVIGILLYWAMRAEQHTVDQGELTKLLEQGETVIDLTELTNFEWTQVDAFGPYTTTKTIEETLGISIRFGVGEVLESNFELVFASDSKIIRSVTLNRKYGDYSVRDNRYLIVEKN